MVVIDQALSDQVLVVLDMLVELAELSNLQHHHAGDQRAKQQEGVYAARNQVAQWRAAHHQGRHAVGQHVWDGQRQSEAGDHGGC